MYALKLIPDTQITHLGTTEALNKLKSLGGGPSNQRRESHAQIFINKERGERVVEEVYELQSWMGEKLI